MVNAVRHDSAPPIDTAFIRG